MYDGQDGPQQPRPLREVLKEWFTGLWGLWGLWVQPTAEASLGLSAAHAALAQQEMSSPRSELFSKFPKFSSKISSQLQS